ncbi:MAG: beta-lactamase family protein [Pseudomonadales bacterium]|nr:beta-lactamase family protein [Pseudomonadales bacterium]
METAVHGTCRPGFERVRDVFARNFTEDADVGAAFCVVRDGETLVDLWGGFRERACTTPWEADTLVNLYSTTKGLGAIAFAWVVDNSALSYDDEVRRYWPELTAARDGLTIAQLLSHQGGICGVDEKITAADLYDWPRMIGLLEKQTPYWTPGTAAGYHAINWGYLPGEITRRVTGRTLGEIFRTEIAAPLQADCYIGLPDGEHARVADMIGPNHARIQPDLTAMTLPAMPPLYAVALQNPSIRPYQDASSAAWRRAEIAAANGQGNARGIARIYAALANAGGPVGARTVARMCREEWGNESDLVLGRALRRSAGLILNTDHQYGPNAESFGHAGAGGSVGFGDPVAGLGVAYVMNQMQMNLNDDTRAGRLVRAVYACLETGR